MYLSEFVKLRAQLGGEMFSPCREPQSKHTRQISRRILHFKLKRAQEIQEKKDGRSRRFRCIKKVAIHVKWMRVANIEEEGNQRRHIGGEKKGVAREDGGEQ